MTERTPQGFRVPRLPIVLVLAGAAALVIAAVVGVPELGDLLPRTADQQAIAIAVERTIVANQSVPIPTARDAAGHVAPETIEAKRAEIRAVAATLFTPSYRDEWAAQAIQVMEESAANEVLFGGGADSFSGWQIKVAGDLATVKVRCRMFLEMAQTYGGPRTRGANIVDYELRLERVGGSWLVGGQTHAFAPGGGP